MASPLSKTSDRKDQTQEANLEDHTLVERSKQGDVAAFDELVQRYKERIYRIIYQMTSSHEDADDLAQEAFIRAFRSIGGFPQKSSFYTWIYRIAVNLTFNHLKKAGRYRSYSLDNVDSGIHRDPVFLEQFHTDTPSRGAALTELRQQLHEAMQKLTPNHRAVVAMHDIQGMTHAQIADILGISEGTVRSRLFYARRELQAHLSDYQ